MHDDHEEVSGLSPIAIVLLVASFCSCCWWSFVAPLTLTY